MGSLGIIRIIFDRLLERVGRAAAGLPVWRALTVSQSHGPETRTVTARRPGSHRNAGSHGATAGCRQVRIRVRPAASHGHRAVDPVIRTRTRAGIGPIFGIQVQGLSSPSPCVPARLAKCSPQPGRSQTGPSTTRSSDRLTGTRPGPSLTVPASGPFRPTRSHGGFGHTVTDTQKIEPGRPQAARQPANAHAGALTPPARSRTPLNW